MEAVALEVGPAVAALREAFSKFELQTGTGRFLSGGGPFFLQRTGTLLARYFPFSFTSLASFNCSVSTRKRL
jgi:hypothetical protein